MTDSAAHSLTKVGEVDGFTVRTVATDSGGSSPRSLADVAALTDACGGVIWLDIVDPTEDQLKPLETEFGLSPLAIEDALEPHERPKIDGYSNYWFLVAQDAEIRDGNLVLHELAVFACPRLVITIRRTPEMDLHEIEARVGAHAGRCASGSGYVLYVILDTIVDGFLPVAEMFTESVEDIEDRLFQTGSRSNRAVLPEIFLRKKEAQRFRRAAVPMRDILNQVVREDVDIFPDEEMPYFRDVYDHAVRVIDELDAARDLVASALDIHLSVNANRQNQIAQQLTMIATIFLPLTFLTGFFGQNFGFLVNHITSGGAFVWFGLGSEVLAVIGLFIFLKARGWF
jgi:magnesium transporter